MSLFDTVVFNYSDPVCSTCGNSIDAFNVAEIDIGIGWNDAFGCRNFDTNKITVSKCCEATIIESDEYADE